MVAVSWRFLTFATLGLFMLITALNASFQAFHDFYVGLYAGSSHLISPTLIIAGTFFAVLMIVLVVVAKIPACDVGWQWSKAARGLALVGGIWIAMQIVELVAGLVSGAGVRLSRDVSAAGWMTAVGTLAGMALALAPAEETFFRGFLLVQLRTKLARLADRVALLVAVVVSQLLFALYHLPNLVLGNSGNSGNSGKVGTGAADIALQVGLDFLIGVVFAMLYLRIGNLFVVIGIHALQNAGTSLVATPIDPSLVIFGLSVALLLATFTHPFRSWTPSYRSS